MSQWQELFGCVAIALVTTLVLRLAYRRWIAPQLSKEVASLGASIVTVLAMTVTALVLIALGWMPGLILIPTIIGAVLGAGVGWRVKLARQGSSSRRV